jgi:hypothetical protein
MFHILCLVIVSTLGYSQNETTIFPAEFLGIWKGKLLIYKGENVTNTIEMSVEHLPTDTAGVYIWSIIYGTEDTGKRPYYLRTVDATKGHYQIDEKNGIVLDSYFVGGKLVSHFLVQGNRLTTSYELVGEEMIFEVIVTKEEKPTITGDIGPEIPPVTSYLVSGYQKAILKKVK